MTPKEQEDKTHTSQNDKYIGWYVVAFLDLLGQQDILRGITILPNADKEEEVREFKKEIGRFYQPLYALKKFFETSIKPFIEEDLSEIELTSDQREFLNKFKETPIFYRHFSDSLIVHIPLRKDMGQFPCRAIFAILAASAATFLSCMSHGWAIRGGIDVGLAMYMDDRDIYGPALARAYALESETAQYPRVVVGEELIHYLKLIAEKEASTPEEEAHGLLAKKSLGLLAVDDDGCAFLDWLGDEIRATFKRTEIVQNAYNFIIKESSKQKEKRNSKLGFRFTLLRNYVESRLSNWGVNIEAD